jgi:hypothetical protein
MDDKSTYHQAQWLSNIEPVKVHVKVNDATGL